MLAINLENGILGFLAILVVGSLFFLHFLLWREYSLQSKIQIQRLEDFEKLVIEEIHRSQSLSTSVSQLQEIKDKTSEKLEVIKLQVEGMKAREGTQKSD